MAFESILFQKLEDGLNRDREEQPDFFPDLNLDQVVKTITITRQEEYNLKPFFHIHLHDVDAIKYRQEIMRDLENQALFESIKTFSQKMHSIRVIQELIEKLYYKQNKQGWFLKIVAIYCDAVSALNDAFQSFHFHSRGFLDFRDYLSEYIHSEPFMTLDNETKTLINDLSTVQYCIHIDGSRVKVRRYESEIDYSTEVEKTFEKFKQGAVKDYKILYRTDVGMNHVEAQIIDLVAKLFPEIFHHLDEYCTHNTQFLDEKIKRFEREIQFYIAYLEQVSLLKQRGLKFCYPEITTDNNKEVHAYECFDFALAYQLMTENKTVVSNDFFLKGEERVFVVSGPNQGGKTTFARTFGQLHYLASLGCPVPGKEARLYLYDRIFTHFEREEDIKTLHGKLQDDLVRIHSILEKATSKSIVILNEIFTSTTMKDAIFLSNKVMEKILELDLLCVWVTFIIELTLRNGKIVSVVSTVFPENPAHKTYKIVRKPADGLSYALTIAEKYRLTQEHIRERIKI